MQPEEAINNRRGSSLSEDGYVFCVETPLKMRHPPSHGTLRKITPRSISLTRFRHRRTLVLDSELVLVTEPSTLQSNLLPAVHRRPETRPGSSASVTVTYPWPHYRA